MKVAVKFWVAILGSMLVLPALASGGGGPKVAEGVNYIPLTPPLVVNYGGPGKARFIKAELSIRTETGEDATEVMHHLPLIRDRLVSILSAQTEDSISTAEGKEYLRAFALAEINKALLKVDGHDVEGHGADEHDDKHSNSAAKPAAGDKVADENHDPATGKADAHKPDETSAPSIADIKPVKGPASDLFFNNFVVQK